MNISKKIYIIFISIIVIMLIAGFICNSYATNVDGLGDLDLYKGQAFGSQTLENKANVIIGVIRILGIVASVAMLIVIGIKYMLGSVEERAEYKKTLVPYLVGAFLLFTGSLVPQLIYQFMQGL